MSAGNHLGYIKELYRNVYLYLLLDVLLAVIYVVSLTVFFLILTYVFGDRLFFDRGHVFFAAQLLLIMQVLAAAIAGLGNYQKFKNRKAEMTSPTFESEDQC